MKAGWIKLAVVLAFVVGGGAASAQDIQERTIKFGHLNNTDHPTSMGSGNSPNWSRPAAAARSR